VKITASEVEHVAHLCRLSFSSGEIEDLTRQLDAILTYVAKLEELDTTGVEPTSHALDLTNAFREDAVEESMTAEAALANAPEVSGGAFVVPRIL